MVNIIDTPEGGPVYCRRAATYDLSIAQLLIIFKRLSF